VRSASIGRIARGAIGCFRRSFESDRRELLDHRTTTASHAGWLWKTAKLVQVLQYRSRFGVWQRTRAARGFVPIAAQWMSIFFGWRSLLGEGAPASHAHADPASRCVAEIRRARSNRVGWQSVSPRPHVSSLVVSVGGPIASLFNVRVSSCGEARAVLSAHSAAVRPALPNAPGPTSSNTSRVDRVGIDLWRSGRHAGCGAAPARRPGWSPCSGAGASRATRRDMLDHDPGQA
jgi:hypothetical protein